MPITLPPGTAAQRDDRNPTPNNRQLLTLLGLLVGLVGVVIGLVGVVINQLVWWIPPSVEQQLGAIAVPPFERLAEPSRRQTELNRLLDRLEAELSVELRQGRDYQVLYVPEPTVNALAIPGDRVIIYQGLLEQMGSENELMMVLGHELGHFAHRDHLRSLGRGVMLRVAIASVLGDLGSLSQIAVSGIERLSQARFSQGQERQADEFGLELLYQTYGHVAGATDFFARMREARGRSITDFMASHPAPPERVKRLEQLIERRNYSVEALAPLPSVLQGE